MIPHYDLYEFENIDPEKCQHEYGYEVRWWRVDDMKRPSLLGPQAFASVASAALDMLLLSENADGEIADQASAADIELRRLLVMMARGRGIESSDRRMDLLAGDLDVLPEVERCEPDSSDGHKIEERLE